MNMDDESQRKWNGCEYTVSNHLRYFSNGHERGMIRSRMPAV